MKEVNDGDLHISVRFTRPHPKFSGNYSTYEKLKPTENKLKEMHKSASTNFKQLFESIRKSLRQDEKLVCLRPEPSTSRTP